MQQEKVPLAISFSFSFSHVMIVISLITIRHSSCGKVMFSQACVRNYVYRGWCPPPDRHPPGEIRPKQAHETATAEDGTHPTGMHSCFHVILNSPKQQHLSMGPTLVLNICQVIKWPTVLSKLFVFSMCSWNCLIDHFSISLLFCLAPLLPCGSVKENL